MSENEIHMLTYSLCHLFTRCDRAVSYPAPTYYAHLAASRGRVYLEGYVDLFPSQYLRIFLFPFYLCDVFFSRDIALDNLEREACKIQTALNFTNSSPMYFV